MQVYEFYIQSSSEMRVRASGYQALPIIEVSERESAPSRIIDPLVVVDGDRVFASSGFSSVSQTVKWFPRAVRLGKARLWEVTLDRLAEMEQDALYPHTTVSAKWTQARNLDAIHKLMDILAGASA